MIFTKLAHSFGKLPAALGLIPSYSDNNTRPNRSLHLIFHAPDAEYKVLTYLDDEYGAKEDQEEEYFGRHEHIVETPDTRAMWAKVHNGAQGPSK